MTVPPRLSATVPCSGSDSESDCESRDSGSDSRAESGSVILSHVTVAAADSSPTGSDRDLRRDAAVTVPRAGPSESVTVTGTVTQAAEQRVSS